MARQGKVHIKVVGALEGSRPQQATVTIDRGAGLFAVRPFRRRREYVLPLSTVAEIVVARVAKADVAAKREGRSR